MLGSARAIPARVPIDPTPMHVPSASSGALVRPKHLAAPNKTQSALVESKRRSARVADDYLEQFLAHGLVSMPNAAAPVGAAVASSRRKRRASGHMRRNLLRAAWVLGTLIVLGGAGLWGLQLRRSERVVGFLDGARQKFATGTDTDLNAAVSLLVKAEDAASDDPEVMATLAMARALRLYVYGQGRADDVDTAITRAVAVADKDDTLGPAVVALAVARAARGLATLGEQSNPQSVLQRIQATLDQALAFSPDDPHLRWLDGMARWAGGDMERARIALNKAVTAANPPPAAQIAMADLELDYGRFASALARYQQVLTSQSGHPMALVGRALARVEGAAEALEIMEDVNVSLSGIEGARVAAWKSLILASVYVGLEDYPKADAEMQAARDSGVRVPRFAARVAVLELERGRIVDAARMADGILSAGADAQSQDPAVLLLRGSLLLTRGRPADALELITGLEGPRALTLRGRALLDLGKADEAAAAFEKVLEVAKDDLRATVFVELARVVAAGARSAESFEKLIKLARGSVSTLPRYALGEAEFATGRLDDARRHLESSIEQNALAYRAQLRLARLYRLKGTLDAAERAIEECLSQAPDFVPARAELARIHLDRGRHKAAVAELEKIVSSGLATGEDELSLAEAQVRSGKHDAAARALSRAKDKGVSAERIGALAAKLGLPAPAGVSAPSPEPSALP